MHKECYQWVWGRFLCIHLGASSLQGPYPKRDLLFSKTRRLEVGSWGQMWQLWGANHLPSFRWSGSPEQQPHSRLLVHIAGREKVERQRKKTKSKMWAAGCLRSTTVTSTYISLAKSESHDLQGCREVWEVYSESGWMPLWTKLNFYL